MVESVLSAGIQGVQHGVSTARQAAEDIVSATTAGAEESPVGDITRAVVDLKIAEQQVQASATVIKTADEILGTIIDTKA